MIARVLIVEDESYLGEDAEDAIREIPTHELTAHGIGGFDFGHAKWGSHARELLLDADRRNRPYHVMFLDLNLPEEQGDRYLGVDVGFGLLEFAKESGAARMVILISAWEDAALRALRTGATDFVPKRSRERDLHPRFLHAWRALMETESQTLYAARIRQLLPQSQLAWATRFSACYSEFLREVARINDNLRSALTEQPDSDSSSRGFDALVQDANRLSEVVWQAKRSWESVAGEMRPAAAFGTADLSAALNECRSQLEPCYISSDAAIQVTVNAPLKVNGWPFDLNTILRELMMGPLLCRVPNVRKIQAQVTATTKGPWAEVIVQDDGPTLTPEECDKINSGFPIMPDRDFDRGWGLSIVQHTAIRGGGRIEVLPADGWNRVVYQVPLNDQEIEHAASIVGGERLA